MPDLLYIRGEPGSGKITVARILEKDLGWKLFWIHDLDPIAKLVGDHKIPRLMDEVTLPILEYLTVRRENIIYVRPSRDLRTVKCIRWLCEEMGYNFTLVTLTARYETLVNRVVC